MYKSQIIKISAAAIFGGLRPKTISWLNQWAAMMFTELFSRKKQMSNGQSGPLSINV
jgi:hypothetical protein